MLKKFIKYAFWMILIIVVIFSVVEIISDTPACVLNNLIKKGALNTKNLTLKVNYLLLIPVGEANLNILGKERFRNADLLHIRAQARTFDYVKSVFHAKATIDSYIDPVELHSVYFMQHLEMINKPTEEKEISYDQKKHIMFYQGQRGKEERVIGEHAQDPLSAIFYIQNKQFALGDEFSLSMNTNQKNYVIKGKFLGRQIITVSGINYEVWLVEASAGRKDKNPRHKTSFKIWFLESEGKKIPILIKAMTNIGPIVAKAK